MIKFSKALVATAVCVALSGCLEVEDDNSELIAALEAQNEILQQQNHGYVVQKPITLYGEIVNATTDELVTEATLEIKVGSEWLEPVTVAGEFSIEELPINTNYIVVIKSPTGAFLDRAFYGRTGSAAVGQVSSQTMGTLLVSEGVVKTYSILDIDDSTPFEGLTFNYNPANNVGSSYQPRAIDDYIIESTFDSTTGLYSILLPKSFSFSVKASNDIDGDGIADYTVENSNFGGYNGGIQLSTDEALQLETLYVNETQAYQPVQLRITAINETGNKIEGISFFASDEYKGNLDTSYDETTQEYVFDYQSSSRVEIMMPSFSTETAEGEVRYDSAQLNLLWSTEETLSLTDYGFVNSLPNEVDVVDGIASLVVMPDVAYNPGPSISRISSVLDESDNYSSKEFYAAPIGLVEDGITLVKYNVVNIIKGNDSPNDIVPAGTTLIERQDQNIAITGNLTHNNTFLTVSPDAPLTSGGYRYQVSELRNQESGEIFNASHSQSFEVPYEQNTTPFDINDIKLDNDNHTTTGVRILTTNTAGINNPATNHASSVYIVLPRSIETLDFFRLYQTNYTRNNSAYSDTRQRKIVENGNIQVSISTAVSLAENENLEGYYYSDVKTGMAVSDGEWYVFSASEYLSDNTGSSTNSITYNYTYRVAGEDTVYEGTITLPVL